MSDKGEHAPTRPDRHREADPAMPPRLREVLGGLFEPVEAQPTPSSGLERYEILAEAGEGGMGKVYRARDTKLGRLVALKLLKTGGDPTGRLRSRFLKEARMGARVSHEHLVQIFDSGEDAGQPFIVMEWIEGTSLAALLQAGHQERANLLRILREASQGVRAIHQAGMVHRDLTPGNILVTADGAAKVTDYGLATDQDRSSGFTTPGEALGTPHYMAPEQVRGQLELIAPPTDIYGLGAILYHILSGAPPFNAPSRAELFCQILQSAPKPPPGPPALRDAALKALGKTPADRFGSLDAFLGALEATSASSRTSLWARVLGVVTVALLIGLAVFLERRTPPEREPERVSVAPAPAPIKKPQPIATPTPAPPRQPAEIELISALWRSAKTQEDVTAQVRQQLRANGWISADEVARWRKETQTRWLLLRLRIGVETLQVQLGKGGDRLQVDPESGPAGLLVQEASFSMAPRTSDVAKVVRSRLQAREQIRATPWLLGIGKTAKKAKTLLRVQLWLRGRRVTCILHGCSLHLHERHGWLRAELAGQWQVARLPTRHHVVELVSAHWGAPPRHADVTAAVRRQLKAHGWISADEVARWRRDTARLSFLSLELKIASKALSMRLATGGDRFQVEPTSSPDEIAARFGSHTTQVDVTREVRLRLEQGTQQIRAMAAQLGIEDFERRKRKYLTIVLELRGQRLRFTLNGPSGWLRARLGDD